MKGRKALPANVRELRGNPGKRKRDGSHPEPAPGTPEMPAWIAKSVRAREAWEMVVPQLEEMRVLTQADVAALALLCQVYADWRRKRTAALAARVQSMLAEFGLTPSARERINLPGKPKSGYGSFRGKRTT